MSRKVLTFILSLFFVVQLMAQEIATDVVILKSGEKYLGEIVLRNDEIIMLKTPDGKRFQFQMKEIEKIGKENNVYQHNSESGQVSKGSFAGIIDLNGGFSFAPSTQIGRTPYAGVSLAFGSRNAFGTNAFLGAGAGYESYTGNGKSSGLSYIPVFIQAYMPLGNSRISPATRVKAGYSFSVNDTYRGGVFFSTSGGINLKLSQTTSFFAGIFGQIQQISGTVIVTNELGEFSGNGNARIYTIGISTAFLF